jgi:hypothetical protein
MKMRGSEADINSVENEFLYKQCELINKYASSDKVIILLSRVASQCVSNDFREYNEKVCLILGQRYMQKQFWSKAYTFFLRANDFDNAINSMKELMKSGYQGEQDLFVVRLCLEILIRNYKKAEFALSAVEKVINAFKDNKRVF